MTSATEPPRAMGAVALELPSTGAFNCVGRLVVGGVASRLDFPVERIEDLQLAVEAVLCRCAPTGSVRMTVHESPRGLLAAIGPFASGTGERAGVEGMLAPLVDEVFVHHSSEGEWIHIGAARDRAPARESP